MDRWADKTAVVTGASAGIGAAITVALADAGMVVVAAARSMGKLQDIQKKFKGKGRILPCRCDMSKEDDIIKLMEFTKKNARGVDVLINNAAFLPPGTITDCSGEAVSMKEVEDCFKINVLGVISATRLAAMDMMTRKVKGHIIMINSVLGHRIINPGIMPKISIYGSSKYAITQLVHHIRMEFGFTGTPIRITGISPGLVDTDMGHSIPDLPELPMLKKEDVADAVIYALSRPESVNIAEITIQSAEEVF